MTKEPSWKKVYRETRKKIKDRQGKPPVKVEKKRRTK